MRLISNRPIIKLNVITYFNYCLIYFSLVTESTKKTVSMVTRQHLDTVSNARCLPQEDVQNSDPTRYHAAWHSLCSAKGVIVPGGFGHRGTAGKMMALRWCREKKVEIFFGFPRYSLIYAMTYTRFITNYLVPLHTSVFFINS